MGYCTVMSTKQLAAATATSRPELAAFEEATRDLVGLALRSVDRLEVSLPQFRLLQVLAGVGRVSSIVCAQALDVAPSSVTRLADRLSAAGYLVRGSDPSNRSVVTLELTEAGSRLVRKVADRRRRELRRVLDQLEPDRRAECADTLRQLHSLLSGNTDGDPLVQLPR